MNSVKIRFRNTLANDVTILLEPEGTAIPLKPDEIVEVEIVDNEKADIEIVINNSETGLNIGLWPEKGMCLIE